MTIYNPGFFAYGVDKFHAKMPRIVELMPLIVPDMPFEEREELLPACKKYGWS